MKVLMVTPSFHPIVGGTETCVKELVVRLNRIGIQSDVMTFNMNKKWDPVWKEEIKENGFKVFRVPAFNPFRMLAIGPLEALFGVNVIPKFDFTRRFEDYDIIHFHDDVDLTFPIFSHFIKKPKILHCHTIGFTYPHYKRNFLMKSLLKKVADLYICSSDPISKLLLDLGFPESHIITLPYGVNIEKFEPDEKLKLDNVILFVGRIGKDKGLDILLQALLYLEIQTQLIIIGPVSDPNFFEEIKNMSNMIAQKNVHKIKFLGKFNNECELIKFYQEASVFVCPSIMTTSPLVNLEALACGTPVIATNVGSIPEIVKDGINGILVPPNDPEKLAYGLKKMLEDKELRDQYGKQGRKMIEQCYSWDQITKKLIKIYEMI